MTLNLETNRLKKLETGLKHALKLKNSSLELPPNINVSYLMEQKRRWRYQWLSVPNRKWQIFTNPNWAPLDSDFEFFCDITDVKMPIFRVVYNHVDEQFEQEFIYESIAELVLNGRRIKSQIRP